jgi:hypothetical protein
VTRKPDMVIGDPARPYLLRWYIWRSKRFGSCYLHKFLRDDDDRALHDHPWWFVSLILIGQGVRMTDEEVLAEMRSGSSYERARAQFSAAWGRRLALRVRLLDAPAPIEVRRMEYEAVARIVAAAAVGRPSDFGPAGEVLRGILAPRESKA